MKALSWCCYCWFEFRAWFRFHVIVVLCSGAEVQTWTKFANRLHLPPWNQNELRGRSKTMLNILCLLLTPYLFSGVGWNWKGNSSIFTRINRWHFQYHPPTFSCQSLIIHEHLLIALRLWRLSSPKKLRKLADLWPWLMLQKIYFTVF